MRKLTIRLDDTEYAALEERARQERRTVRDLAAYLVTRPPNLWEHVPVTPWTPLMPPFKVDPIVTTDRTTRTTVRCPACTIPGSVQAHTCIRGWQAVSSGVRA